MRYLELEEYFEYLDELRESGVTNMFAAPSYLQDRYSLDKVTARVVFKVWADTFDPDTDLDDRVVEGLDLLEIE